MCLMNETPSVDAGALEGLLREQEQVRNQIEFVVDELGSIGRDAAKRKIQQLEAKLASLNERIDKASPTKVMSPAQVQKAADKIVARPR